MNNQNQHRALTETQIRKIERKRLRRQEQRQEQSREQERQRQDDMVREIWRECEAVMNILRCVQPQDAVPEDEAFSRWKLAIQKETFDSKAVEGGRIGTFNSWEDVDQSAFVLHRPTSSVTSGHNNWFKSKFPEAFNLWGAPFHGGEINFHAGLDQNSPVSLNHDTLAGIISGSKRLRYKTVYLPTEDTFYVFDYLVAAYIPVSVNRLKLMCTKLFLSCAEDCSSAFDIRKLANSDGHLSLIIQKAKAVCECERGFFTGPNGKRRFVNGAYIDPQTEPSYKQFVKKAIVRQPEAKLTVSDAFGCYHRFCNDNSMPALTRTEFKDLVSGIIRDQFDVGLRHDILGDGGKQTHGWDGLACPLEPVSGLN